MHIPILAASIRNFSRRERDVRVCPIVRASKASLGIATSLAASKAVQVSRAVSRPSTPTIVGSSGTEKLLAIAERFS